MTKPSLSHPSFISASPRGGYVECVGQWGHGRAAAADFGRMPAILMADDGDGHYFAYRVFGMTMREAAEIIAPLFAKGEMVVTFSGSSVVAERAPHDFWIEKSDEFRPNLAAYPDVIAW